MELKFIETTSRVDNKGIEYTYRKYDIGNYRVVTTYIEQKLQDVSVNINHDCCKQEEIYYMPSIIYTKSRKKDKASHYTVCIHPLNHISMEEAQKTGKYLQEAAEVIEVLAKNL